MIRIVFMFFALTFSLQMCAQKNNFDPKKFQADLEQYITIKAGLTPQEASVFFPLYKEMCSKQRMYFGEMRRYRHVDTSDNIMCEEAIKKIDQNDIQIKTIQQLYHNRFLKILPANKVMKIIKAEDKFHKNAFKNMARKK